MLIHCAACSVLDCLGSKMRCHSPQAKTRGAAIGPFGVALYGGSGSASEEQRREKAELAAQRCGAWPVDFPSLSARCGCSEALVGCHERV